MHVLPAVTITNKSRQRLVAIAKAALASEHDGRGASMLLSEIARATVVQPGNLPPNVVDMNCEVDVRDNIKQTTDRLRIVYPGQEETGGYRVSVLTPVGAGASRPVGRGHHRLVYSRTRQEKPYGTPGSPWNVREWASAWQIGVRQPHAAANRIHRSQYLTRGGNEILPGRRPASSQTRRSRPTG
jgi:hypothetical protein